MKKNVKKWFNQDFRIEETTWFVFRIQPGFSKQLLQVAYIAETGEWALRKQKRWDFSRSINLFGRVFPPFRSDAPALVFILEPPPTHTVPHTQSNEMLNRNALIFGSTIYGIIFWQKCAPLLRSKVPGKSAKKLSYWSKYSNIQLGRSLKSVNSGESGLPAGHSPPSPSFPDRRYHHWCHRHQCTIIFVWP